MTNEENALDNVISQRTKHLLAKRREIISLPAEKMTDAILEYPQPAALVHSFPQEDFYFLIHEIGVEDSMELLALASERQWEYITDIEIWQKDRLDMASLTRWFHTLAKADPDRMIRWFLKEKTELTELYLFRNIELVIREHDQDPSDFGDGFFTLDDVFYIRFRDNIADTELAEQRERFLSDFLERLADYDHVAYQNTLLEFGTLIPAESEEEEWRLRNIRLAEKGFVPFDEAVGIYQPLSAKAFAKKIRRQPPSRSDDLLPVPHYPFSGLENDNLFARALTNIGIEEVLHQVRSEFAALCNHILSADGSIIREKEELRAIVGKACGYLSIGLQRLTSKRGKTEISVENYSGSLIRRYPLADIFRLGYGLALHLKWKAGKWRKTSWFKSRGLPLAFWGEQWLGTLGGLLIKRPKYFDNYETGVLYREFRSLEDMLKTEAVLKEIMAADELLSRMKIEIGGITPNLLCFENLVLTMWARHHLGLPEEVSEIGMEDFRRFFGELWTGKPKKIRKTAKQAFLSWVSEKSDTDIAEITGKSGRSFESMFDKIESEYRDVSEKDLDARFVSMFLIRGQP